MTINKRLLWWLVITVFLLQAVIPPHAIARNSTNKLTMDEAVYHAIRNSSGIRDVKTERIKKTAERKEAVEAIKIARRREKFPWFSLLMDINLPQRHYLPKEIELMMKVPEIQTALQVLREKEKYEILKAKHDAKEAYLDVLLAKYNVQRNETYIAETSATLERLRRQQRIGLADRNDVEYLEAELESYQNSLQKAVQDLERKLEKLSKITNIKLNINTVFDEYLPNADINRDHLDQMIEHAIKHNFDLYQATQERKIAQTQVLELINIYENRWGSRVRSMTRYIQNQLGRQVEKLDARLNYDVFLNNYYEPALSSIEAPFSGNFRIKILFVTIKIPKEWFKLGTLGERYFDNEKYALFNALVDRDKAIDLEDDIRASLIQQVKDTYFTLKQMELAYEETKRNLVRSERDYLASLRENQIGLVSFQELHSEKINYYSQQDSLYEMMIDYGKTIAMFNLYTSGYLDVLRGDFQATDLLDGDSFLTDDIEGPSWYMQSVLTDYKFTFGVNIPQNLGITHYELFTGNHAQIGEKTVVSNTISHLPITYEDSSMLYVKLYQEEDLVYIAELDGFDIYGPLVLQEADQYVGEAVTVELADVVGTWSINSANLFRAVFEFEINQEIVWNWYGLYYYSNGAEITLGNQKFAAGQPLSHLPSTLTEPEKFILKLYLDEAVVKELSLLELYDGVGLIMD